MAERLKKPIVASDFSLSVLRRDKQRFEFLGLEQYVSLLAFDARRTPFRDGSIRTMTTNLGLPNVEEPGRLLHELNRIVGGGTMLAISHFFPTDDKANLQVIEDAGLAPLLYRSSAVEHFESAGWSASVENVCLAEALPTPESTILDGARADGLPVAPTELEWCVVRATVAH
jgi:ubiquinone/menaquinone biosynthesis C-methylase UbiE